MENMRTDVGAEGVNIVYLFILLCSSAVLTQA